MGEEEIVALRTAKLERLRSRGIDPYPPRFHPSHTTQQAADLLKDRDECPDPVTLAGRVTAMRHMGKATFIDLRDNSGRIQTYLKEDVLGPEAYETLRDLDVGDFLGVRGPLFHTKTGEPTVQVEQLTVLAKALRAPPEKWHGLQDVEVRYRQRYLDLVANPQVRDAFLARSSIISAVRRFLDERGFLEVETPVLQPAAGGAAARPFVTYHNALDRQLYLRIALELYLKRLVIGGYDRVYEIGRIFRNEGVSAKHNPEFTMLESYQAYADYNDVMDMVEQMVATVAREALGGATVAQGDTEIDLTPPWPRITLRDAIKHHAGVDFEEHPDVESLREAVASCGVPVDEKWGRGKLIDELLSAKVEPNLVQPTYVLDYPLELSPLAKRKPDNPHLVERF
jgi:lysyl-tRNA synthetase class 2